MNVPRTYSESTREPDGLTRNDKAGWGAGFVTNTGNNASPDSPVAAELDQLLAEKNFSTLRARLALAGWMLTAQADGAYLASRWGHCRELGDLSAVESFAQMVGAR